VCCRVTKLEPIWLLTQCLEPHSHSNTHVDLFVAFDNEQFALVGGLGIEQTLPKFLRAGWERETELGAGGAFAEGETLGTRPFLETTRNGRFLTRSEQIMEEVYRDSQLMPSYRSGASDPRWGLGVFGGSDARNPATNLEMGGGVGVHGQLPRRTDEWWYNDTGAFPPSSHTQASSPPHQPSAGSRGQLLTLHTHHVSNS
jgi:hypothetical protein